MRRWSLSAILAAAAMLLIGARAEASPVGTVVWNDATFTVELTGVSGDQYTFELTADFTGFTPGLDQTGNFNDLIGINFKPSQGDVTGFSNTSQTAAGLWVYNIDSNLSSSNTTCANEPGNNNFFCGANTTNWLLNPTAGNPKYTFDFTLTITGVSDADSLVLGAPLRALFGSYVCNNHGCSWHTSLMSETTGTGVPEPTSLALISLGAATFGVARRKRKTPAV